MELITLSRATDWGSLFLLHSPSQDGFAGMHTHACTCVCVSMCCVCINCPSPLGVPVHCRGHLPAEVSFHLTLDSSLVAWMATMLPLFAHLQDKKLIPSQVIFGYQTISVTNDFLVATPYWLGLLEYVCLVS